jgi:hypothetical protein
VRLWQGTPGPWGGGALLMPFHASPQLSDELKQHLSHTLTESYGQPRALEITASVDRLQQDVSHQVTRVHILTLSLPICVTLSKLFTLSELPLTHL